MIDAATFLVSAFLMILIKYQKPQAEAKEVKFTLFSFAKEGFREIKKYSTIKVIVLTTIFFGILGRFYEIDKIYMADKVLNIGAEGIIFFAYAMSVGSLLAPFVLQIFEKKDIPAVRTYAYLSIFTVVSFVLWGISTNLYICLFANLILGIFNTGNAIYVNVIFQKEVDSQYLGRVMSFYKICMVCSAVVGALCAPILVKILGVGGSMAGVGVIALIGIAVILYRDRKHKKAR